MNNLGSALISKALAGLVILVPLAILFLAVMEVYGLLEDMAAFAKLELPFPPIINGLIFIALGILAIFAVCLLTGLLITAGPGRKFANFVENVIADKIPLLGLLRNLTISITGAGESQLKPAEINLYGDGACQYGFLIEVLQDGRYVVFIPGAPAVTLGQTFIVPAERVKLLDTPITTVVNTITQWGKGANDIYKQK